MEEEFNKDIEALNAKYDGKTEALEPVSYTHLGKLLEQAHHLSYLPAEGELYDHVRIASGALEILDKDGEVEDWGPGSASITTLSLLKSWFEERPFANMPDIDLPDGFVYVITYTMKNSRHINHTVTFSDGSMWFIEDNFNRVFALEKRD